MPFAWTNKFKTVIPPQEETIMFVEIPVYTCGGNDICRTN
jgi:hypothetical protein